ncbi:hypothetical protein [Microbacterium sorbitolivorans]|uniref:Uncharacterized protein n=1 Tax=Microbacterium sorbitolivorans TaxID=1867410 RepID=A0A367Y6U6_9MICO|nr:hypothetical protein [Microbacterium sorbitolivorans]RCK61584.1 hypothetical protein DTO57_02820 [Microbacterium sorbitolivorans]
MAEFPWQKPHDDDKAPRFPWQGADEAKSEGTADEVAPEPESSMPWRKRDDAAPEHVVPAPEPAASRWQSPAADERAREPEVRSPDPAAEPREPVTDPPVADAPEAHQTGPVSDPPVTDSPAWQPPAAAPTSSRAQAPADGEIPPSTFTPPWRPEEPRPKAKKARPTPPTVATSKAQAAPKASSGRAGRIAAVTTFVGLGAAILVGVGAAVVSPMLGDSRDDREPISTPTPTVIPLAAGEIGLDAATTFVNAIAGGNATLALSMLGHTATSLTSDDAWAAMVENYPISDVQITPLAEDAWENQVFAVSYMMDDELIDFTLTVDVDVNDPENVVFDVDLPTLEITEGYEAFDMTLNGVAFDASGSMSYEVFPGAYTLGTTTEYFTIPESVIVAESGMVFMYPYDREPTLTDDGIAKFREVVRAAAEACISSTTLAADCGLEVTGGIQGGAQIIDGTVERSLTDEQWAEIDAMVPTSSAFDGAQFQEGDYIGDVAFVADWQQGGSSGRDQIYGGPWLYAPTVDFSDPDLPVTWD